MPDQCTPKKIRSLADRFWPKVEKTDTCWLWTAYAKQGGYGMMHYNDGTNRPVLAHRVSWELHYGPIPDGLCVLHQCDNPRCVRPDHLFLGTRRDNTHDMLAKGRHWTTPKRGEQNHAARLTEQDIRLIRSRYEQGASQTALGQEYRVTKHCIWRIVHRKNWTHVQ